MTRKIKRFSHLLLELTINTFFAVIFFLIVTPAGLIRKLFGIDPLKLDRFKDGTDSVMIERNIKFGKNDFDRPY
jgi:hypothetical protein